ncbi:MAG: ATP-binding protein [Planctomycetes bacterium]|nr:ATP-binding protein [Planctomycetota bacterium]
MTSHQVRLEAADSFDLIRLLARSQNDPRKAVCELVQNSLDAQAAHVEVNWLAEKSERVLRIVDDGRGIFPELAREDALRRIATTIGHSHKRDLTPSQRRELMALGKYGIGLLGFWAVGREMEIKSRVGGSETWVLRLREDDAHADLERARSKKLTDDATFTEVTIRGVHEGAARQVRPGRLQAYLSSELRGQLLERDVEIRIHDRVARGRAVKEFVVLPQRFRGVAIEELEALAVPGHEDARVELYLVPAEDERRGAVALCCGGTTVLDDLATVEGADALRGPWDSGRIEGVVDFPEFDVAPGTRRGFRADARSEAFLAALPALEARVRALLDDDDKRRQEERDKNLARRIQRVFRRIPRHLPGYDLFDVKKHSAALQGAARDARIGAEGAELADASSSGAVAAAAEAEAEAGDAAPEPMLFAPGPLAELRITPAKSRIPPNSARVLRARAVDADGRPVGEALHIAWRLEGPGELRADGARAEYVAPPFTGDAVVHAEASDGERRAVAQAAITIADDAGTPDAGIPEPIPVHAAGEPWRSRMRERAWEYNTGHRDYVAASASEARRLRYLVQLFAKEVVLRNFGGDGALLERMVEVLTYLDESEASAARAGG